MRISLILAIVFAACSSQAQVRTLTRTVTLFGGLERQVTSASNTAKRATYLTDDFEERLCAEPGTPIPHDTWLAQPARNFSFSQQAVHDYGEIAIYSALATALKQRFAIVDIWKKQGEDWKLAVRYLCPASGGKPSSPIEKRY